MGGEVLVAGIHSISALSIVLAWLVVRRTREHVWAAAFLTWMLANDLTRHYAIRLPSAPHPRHGLPLFVWFFDQILVTGWTFPFLAVCAIYFLRRRGVATFALLGWAALSGAIVVAYPTLVGARLFAMYRVLCWFGVASSWLMILLGVFGDRALKPKLAHLVVILYAATDLVAACFPFLKPLLRESWNDVRWLNLFTVSACCAAHVIALGRTRAVEEAPA